MPSAPVQFGVLLFAAVAAVVLASGIRAILKSRERCSRGAFLLALTVTLTFSFVQLLATYFDGWVKVVDVYRNVSYEVPPWGQAILRIVMVFIIVGGPVLFLSGMRRRDAQVNVAAVLLVLVLLVSWGSSLLHGQAPVLTYSLVYFSILLACVFAPRGHGAHLGIAVVAMFAAISSGLALLLREDFSVIACKAGYKCGVLGFNFRGVLDNENAFALYLTLAMPFVYIAFAGWRGAVMAAYITLLVVLTGSRSGTLAALVTFAALVVIRPDVRKPQQGRVRPAALAALLASVIAVGLALPFVTDDPTAFTGRAALWQLAQDTLATPGNFFYGTGLFGWDNMREAGLIDASAVYSVHNQWLHVLFSTGVIGLVCFLGAIAVLLWQSRGGYFTVVGCVLVPMLVLSVTERPWPIDVADWLTWSVPGALLCYPLVRRPAIEDGEPLTTEVPRATADHGGDRRS